MSALTLSNRRWLLLESAAIWALIALLLNLPWEIAQLPLYEFSPSADSTHLAYYVLHCTAGDALIATTIFLLAGLMLSGPDWPSTRPWTGVVIATLLGVGTEVSIGNSKNDIISAIRQSAQENTNQAGQQFVERQLDI